MTQGFDKHYWESHWHQAERSGPGQEIGPNPHLVAETRDLAPGTALDAGCGEGAEALWLAAEGWQVTAADISAEALSRASERASADGPPPEHIRWVEADLSVWEPGERYDLVTTHYAHPAMPQLAFYERIAAWVAPGGTLLVVGHLHGGETAGADPAHGHVHGPGHGEEGQRHAPPEEASVTAASIADVLDVARWDVVTAEEHCRSLGERDGRPVELHDVVVRATRRS